MLGGINSVNLRNPYSYDQKRQNNVTFQAGSSKTEQIINETEQKAVELGKEAVVKVFEVGRTVEPKVQKAYKGVRRFFRKCDVEAQKRLEKRK